LVWAEARHIVDLTIAFAFTLKSPEGNECFPALAGHDHIQLRRRRASPH